MPKNQNLIKIDDEGFALAKAVKGRIEAKSGGDITIGNTVKRALQLMDESLSGGRFLSPKEVTDTYLKFVREDQARVIVKLLAKLLPDGVQVDDVRFNHVKQGFDIYTSGETELHRSDAVLTISAN